MDNVKNILILAIPLCLSLIYMEGCSSSSNPSEEELQTELLAKTWTAGNVTLNNNNVSSWFEGMELTLVTDQTFTAKIPNSPSPWPASGSWGFVTNADGSANLQTIQRNDGLLITISKLTAEELIITFTYNESEQATSRKHSVSGSYLFEFAAK